MKKNDKYEIHEIANIFPMMTADDYTSLKNDIIRNGIKEPIILFKNKIVDGRNRYKVCIENNIKPIFKEYSGTVEELENYILSLNLHRRHLTTSQKSCIAVERMPYLEQRTKDNLSKKISAIRKKDATQFKQLENTKDTAETLSEMFGISKRYIFEAKKLHKDNIELFNQVKAGGISLQQALKLLKNDIQVSAKLHKPETIIPTVADIKISSKDQAKAEKIATDLNCKIDQAIEFIKWNKKQRLQVKKQPNMAHIREYKEVKFRLTPTAKDQLQSFAKNHHKSISEVLRELVEKQIM